MTNDYGKELRNVLEALEAMRKEEEVKAAFAENLKKVVDGFKQMKDSKLRAEFSVDRVKQLEETMPEFAEATQEGFTPEQTKRIITELADYFIEQMKLDRLEKSYIITLLKLKVKEIDFSKCTGEALYEYAVENNLVEILNAPDFKKKCIVTAAVEMVVKKGNITFNTAIRRIINKSTTDEFVNEQIEETKPDVAEFCTVINPLIDWYLENETDILQVFLGI